MSYDALDRLIKVDNSKGVYHYTYDSFGRRLTKRNTTIISYLYQGEREIAAYENGKLIESRLLGRGKPGDIGSIVAVTLNDKTYATLTDFRGSLTHLVPIDHDQPISSFHTTAFGELEGSGEVMSPWIYCSKRHDPETGLVYFGKRYYIPELGRWLTPDPAGYQDGLNLYAYVHNSPLSLIDPYGLASLDWSSEAAEERSHVMMQSSQLIGMFKGLYRSIMDPLEAFLSLTESSGGYHQHVDQLEQASFTGQKIGEAVGFVGILRSTVLGGIMLGRSILKFGAQRLFSQTAKKGLATSIEKISYDGIKRVAYNNASVVAREEVGKAARINFGKQINNNPFKGNVSKDIIIVDVNGNAISVRAGQRLTGSPDGKWIQVRDSFGNPTGLRKDGAHTLHTHNDPRALVPHAHIPGVTNIDGTPWLTINY